MRDEYTGIEAQNDPDFASESLTFEELEEKQSLLNTERSQLYGN